MPRLPFKSHQSAERHPIPALCSQDLFRNMSPKSGKRNKSIKPPNSSKTAKSMKSMSPANASTPTLPRKTAKPTKPRKERDRGAAVLKGVTTKRAMRADKVAKEAQAARFDRKGPPRKNGALATNKRKRPSPGSDDMEPGSNCSSFGEHDPKDVVRPQSRPTRLPPMHDMPIPRTPSSSQSRQPSSENEPPSLPGRFSPNVYKPLNETTCPHVDTLNFRNEIPYHLTADAAGFDRHKHTFEMPEKRFADGYTVIQSNPEERSRKARRQN
ncbi:hypothetical protein DL95DRAFT_110211 [Leptodontidium sp. 2 PMI_412]|nr:hypothetical protein DL95DRAFT_110211 [Leptodontidium sp. 2 PMI_412]